jgi:hypothetical protein
MDIDIQSAGEECTHSSYFCNKCLKKDEKCNKMNGIIRNNASCAPRFTESKASQIQY